MINHNHLILKITERIITVMLTTASEPVCDNTTSKYIDAHLAIANLRGIIGKNHDVLQREKARHKPLS
jgi:hypothetical protein